VARITDSKSRPVYFNKAWYDYTGASVKGNWNWEDYMHPDDWERYRSRWLFSIKNNRPFEIEYRWRRHDGQVRWMLGRANPVDENDGSIQLWIGTNTDIHEKKLAEQELEMRVAARTKALLESNKELQRSNEDLEQFAYVASHDLKEPLRMIASYAQLLSRKIDTKDPEAAEFVHFMENGVAKMKLLINDLLEYSRIGTGDELFSSVDLNKVLEYVEQNLAIKLKESGATIVRRELPQLYGNSLMIMRLFQNLIENAIKFSREEELPKIEITSRQVEKNWLISVKDNGIGIDPQYHERIFSIFQRLHPADKYSGTGIGLSICRKIMEQHHGEIWLESKAGEGTVFHMAFPLHKN
jgi:PAS domain S-box-containing protein